MAAEASDVPIRRRGRRVLTSGRRRRPSSLRRRGAGARPRPKWLLGPGPRVRSASSSATSAPARSTPCARPWRHSPQRRRRPSWPCWASSRWSLWALILIVTHQVRRLPDAGRQQGRGRHPGPDGAGPARARPALGLIFFLGVCGAALFYGDGIITPAISVLSAIEGLQGRAGRRAERSTPYVVPIAGGILIALFLVQSRGTASVASFFGPITARLVPDPGAGWASCTSVDDLVDPPRPVARTTASSS